MSSEVVTYEVVDNIAVIALNRPEKRNAMNNDLATALRAAWDRFNASDERVAILTHTGPHFSVGVDVKAPAEDFPACVPNVGVRLDKPLIAAVSGWTVGGAVVMVQMADLCVAADTTKFMFPEAKVGFTGALIAGLAARIPHKVAMEMMLLCRVLDPQRAFNIGLVNEVVPTGQQVEAALRMAREMTGFSPLVLKTLKRFVTEAVLAQGPSEQSGRAQRTLTEVKESEDAEEAKLAVKERRKAAFTGR